MPIAGVVFASSHALWILVLAGTLGVISPSGNEVGPFLPIEQAALAHVATDRTRTEVLAGTRSSDPSRRRSARWRRAWQSESCTRRRSRRRVDTARS
jgi:hypothetical protein